MYELVYPKTSSASGQTSRIARLFGAYYDGPVSATTQIYVVFCILNFHFWADRLTVSLKSALCHGCLSVTDVLWLNGER